MSTRSGAPKTIGVAVLSWKSPLTIKASLQTYVDGGLLSLFDDVVLCFQEMSADDEALAKELGIRYVGNVKNTGIQGGFLFAYNSLQTDYVIILENDLGMDPAVSVEDARRQLIDCVQMIERGKADMARIRRLFNPGPPIRAAGMYSRYYPVVCKHPDWADSEELDESPRWRKFLRRILRPGKAHRWSGRAVYVEKNPEQLFPDIIKKQGDYLLVDSSVMPWTNQPTLISRNLLGELLDYAETHPSTRTVNGFQDLEKPLNGKYWKNKHYQIAIAPGIFTHKRLDR